MYTATRLDSLKGKHLAFNLITFPEILLDPLKAHSVSKYFKRKKVYCSLLPDYVCSKSPPIS